MADSDSDGPAPTKKRSRINANTGSSANGAKDNAKEGKKPRGRPRVDTPNASAADRRREQIRLAQRAYRQRKETTIASLKQEGSQLHSIIDQMNKAFLQFNDSALKSGLLQLNPTLANELKQVTEIFASLAKTATDFEGNDEEHGEAVEVGSTSTSSKQKSRSIGSPTPENSGTEWGYSTMLNQSKKSAPGDFQPQNQTSNYFQDVHGVYSQPSNSLVPKRQFTIGEILNQSGNSSSQHQPTSTTPQQAEQLPFGLIDLGQQHVPFAPSDPNIIFVNIPTPGLTPPTARLPTPPLQIPSLSNKTLAPAFTYSHEETTFARRLTRAALETAFHLLCTAHVRPTAINYVFRLSLPFFGVDELRERLRSLLSRTVHEDLDFWETPFVHIGGAGTHYPRKDAHGNIISRQINRWTVRRIGPRERHMARLERPDDGKFLDHPIDLTPFEGEWFDAYDVAGYLEERWSCTPNPRNSFAECLIEEDDHEMVLSPDPGSLQTSDDLVNVPSLTPTSTKSSSASSSAYPGSISPPNSAYNVSSTPFGLDMSFNHPSFPNFNDFSKFNNIDLSLDQTLGLDLAPGYDYGFTADAGFAANMNLGLDPMDASVVEPIPVVKQKKKRVAWVETSKLIDEIIKHGVCLGRAPGFRRKDVDMAVQNSLI